MLGLAEPNQEISPPKWPASHFMRVIRPRDKWGEYHVGYGADFDPQPHGCAGPRPGTAKALDALK